MSTDNYFKIFSNPKSHSKWDNHIEFASLNTSITEDKRTEWVEALKTLKLEFGNDFLIATAKKQNRFAELIKGKAPWQISELTDAAQALRFLSSYNSNYSKLVGKLRGSKIDVAEGMSFLEVVNLFKHGSFRTKFLEEIKTIKSPDIELEQSFTNEKIFIEVSELFNSQSRNHLKDNYHALYNLWETSATWLPYSCSQKQAMTEKQLANAISNIKKAKVKAEVNKTIIDFEDDLIRFSVAHPSKYEELMASIDKNDYRKGLLGAPLNFDETERLCSNKLKQKAKQIPNGNAGLIFISVNPLYFMVTDLNKAIDRFVQKMQPFSNIFGIILFGSLLNSDEAFSEETHGHIYRVKKVENALSKYITFIRNIHCEISLSKETQENIYLSLKH